MSDPFTQNLGHPWVWAISVEFPQGGTAVYEFENDPGFRVSETVKKSDTTIVRP